jgi:hypothetical protein
LPKGAVAGGKVDRGAGPRDGGDGIDGEAGKGGVLAATARGGKGGGKRANPLTGKLDGEDSPVSDKEAKRKIVFANGKIKELEAKIKAQGDPKKRAQLEISLAGYQASRDYYTGLVTGEVKPFEPPPPKTVKPYWDAVNEIIAAGKDLVGKGSPGAGIPIGRSYTENGDKSQYGTQKTQSKTKPAKSAPDAKKTPSANMTKFGKYELKPNK